MMNQQEIKDRMSKGQWIDKDVVKGIAIMGLFEGAKYLVIDDCKSSLPSEMKLANASAICSAVNNTYGAGINPDKVPDIIKLLTEMEIYLSSYGVNSLNEIKSTSIFHVQMKKILNEAKLK